jgi:hypothetical protein
VPACGSCTSMGHVVAGAASVCSFKGALECVEQCISRWGRASERFPSRGPGPPGLSR